MTRRWRAWSPRRVAFLSLSLSLIALVAVSRLAPPGSAVVSAATLAYPDLQTLAPSDLRFDTVIMADGVHNVLRFSNEVANLGQGPLELVGALQPDGTVLVTQNIYTTDGTLGAQVTVGTLVYDPEHGHWHFANFAWYQLYTAVNGQLGQSIAGLSVKTGFCMVDTSRVDRLAGTPRFAVYTQCTIAKQGISVGWADIYAYNLPEQWVDLGPAVAGSAALTDGTYALKSTADPLHQLQESNPGNNDGITFFRVQGGRIHILH